jgi:hypothetical protein
MQSIANLTSSSELWFGISFCALLAFAFGADNSAKRLGLTVIDSTKTSTRQDFSLLDFVKLVLGVGFVLAVWHILERLEFWVTIATLFALCVYIWVTGFQSKIRKLQRAGLSSIASVGLISLFTFATSSLFIGLAMSAWAKRGAP